jgi:hypothetical protein
MIGDFPDLLNARRGQQPATRLGWSSDLQVLVNGFAADPEGTGQCCLRLPGRGPLPQFSHLRGGERFLAAPVDAALLGQCDPLALPLAQQCPFELGIMRCSA